MNTETTRAAINLHAILRNLEDLCLLDEDARQQLQGHNLSICMQVPGLDPLTLQIKEGCLKAVRERAGGGLQLRFFSPRHFNRMVDGAAMPLPTGGFQHLGFLQRNFTALAKILERCLKPEKDKLTDPDFAEKNTRLTAAAALYAVSEIANTDPLGQQIANAMGDGKILLEVPGALAYTISSVSGRLTTSPGAAEDAVAFMRFDSLHTLGQVLRGEADSYLLIGRGQIQISGRIPMVDNLNKLLRLVSFYLS